MTKARINLIRSFSTIPGEDILAQWKQLDRWLAAGGRITKKAVSQGLRRSKIHISRGNSKLGKIWNWSLAPMTTCTAEACATCGQKCYACRDYRQYPNTKRARDENTNLVLDEDGLELFEAAMVCWFQVERPRFFRVHTSGDFATVDYSWAWFRIAQRFRGTKFLAYSKQWEKVRAVPFDTLPNFSLKLSHWPGTTIPADLVERYEIAYLIDGSRPGSSFPALSICPGSCEHCKQCWIPGAVVGFKIHGVRLTQAQQAALDQAVAEIKQLAVWNGED